MNKPIIDLTKARKARTVTLASVKRSTGELIDLLDTIRNGAICDQATGEGLTMDEKLEILADALDELETDIDTLMAKFNDITTH